MVTSARYEFGSAATDTMPKFTTHLTTLITRKVTIVPLQASTPLASATAGIQVPSLPDVFPKVKHDGPEMLASLSSISVEAKASSSSAPSQTIGGGALAAPSPTQRGVAADCTKWHKCIDSDGCPSIAKQYGVDVTEFKKWNPAVKSDCTML